MGCTSAKSISNQSTKNSIMCKMNDISTQTDDIHQSETNLHINNDKIEQNKFIIANKNDEFIKDICFPIHRYVNNHQMLNNGVIIDMTKISISKKIRYGTISRIYYGKLSNSDSVIDVILKGTYKVDIVRYQLYQYILRELLIGLSLCKYSGFVKYIGMTYDEHQIYLVMEQFGENNLSEYLSMSKLSIDDKICLCKAILNIIVKLHELNIVHRDIKLSNFVIKNGQIKLCDMGTAVINTQSMNTYCGTLTHMSPFIKSHQNYDINIDWWSYAVTILEFFFDLDNIDLMVNNIVENNSKIRSILFEHFKSSDYINESLIDLLHYIFSSHLSKKYISDNVLLNSSWFNQIRIKSEYNVDNYDIPLANDLSLSPFNKFIDKCSRLSFIDNESELIITDGDTHQKYNPLNVDVAYIMESVNGVS